MTDHHLPVRTTVAPLAITADPGLVEQLQRLATDAGVTLQVAPDPATATEHHPAAPLVLLGLDQAAAYRRTRLPRRNALVLVAWSPAATDPFRHVEAVGARHVALLPAAEPWLREQLAACRQPATPAPTVAVLGGRGGAGASTLAAALASIAAGRGRRVLLVDADPLGGGIDLLLGCEDHTGPRWAEVAEADPRQAEARLDVLPTQGQLALLSFDRRTPPPTLTPQAITAVLHAGRRLRDLVVVDVPRWPDPAGQAALAAADLALLVVPARLRAATAAAQVAAAARSQCTNLQLVVTEFPTGLRAEQVADALMLPLAGTLRPEPGLAAAAEAGQPPASTGRGQLAALCRRLVDQLCPPPQRR